MSATDKLRRLLDERGVEHRDYDHSDERVTEWAKSCGWRANGKPTNFCPNCGRQAVSE